MKNWYDDQTLGTIAEGDLFRLRNLSVGKPAPEIVGKDHEGKPFALGDYRGKVVVLTFSGNWCGPCVMMYPQERTLVTRSSTLMIVIAKEPGGATAQRALTLGWPC